jgi:cytochrome bd ubiquinol oxidase subunit II
VPLLVAVASVGFFVSLRQRRDYWPFLLAIALFALCLAGLGISIYPEAVPGAVTIHEAAAPHSSLVFMLVGFVLLIPIILAYTGYSYWVFRGKTGDVGYH